jgi:hypothetical protein
MHTAVKGSMDLLVVVAILFEDIPQEHQFSLQAVLFGPKRDEVEGGWR